MREKVRVWLRSINGQRTRQVLIYFSILHLNNKKIVLEKRDIWNLMFFKVPFNPKFFSNSMTLQLNGKLIVNCHLSM